jgi:hypothetical protein
MSAVRAAALEYAARGWYVLPLDPHSHLPVSPRHDAATCDRSDPWCKKRHLGWESRATTDLQRVEQIWQRGTWDVGIACGPSKLLVIDTETPHHLDAENTIIALARAHAALPPTWTVATPSGGLHRYYAIPVPLPTTRNLLGPHIGTTGARGYVIAPPAQTVDGPYADLITRPVAPLPPWIAQLLTPKTTPKRWARFLRRRDTDA